MSKLNIYTTLDIVPRRHSSKCCCNEKIASITRGASAIFTFSLKDKIYTLDSLYQVTFLLKQGRTTFSFDAFKYNGDKKEWNTGDDFSFSYSAGLSSIELTLDPKITSKFKSTENGNSPMFFEVVTVVMQANERSLTLVEVESEVNVQNSIYGDLQQAEPNY